MEGKTSVKRGLTVLRRAYESCYRVTVFIITVYSVLVGEMGLLLYNLSSVYTIVE